MMRPATRNAVVFVTAPDLKTARRLARGIVEGDLAACANLVPRLESHYRWKGRLEKAAEVLLIIKTTRQRLPALERYVLEHHPYETPEFLVLRPSHGSAAYLKWIDAG